MEGVVVWMLTNSGNPKLNLKATNCACMHPIHKLSVHQNDANAGGLNLLFEKEN